MAFDKILITALIGFCSVWVIVGANTPMDPVFRCLTSHSQQAYDCYKTTYHYHNQHRGGSLGPALGQLLPADYKTWAKKKPAQRAQKCITALMNFVEPLRAVIASEQGSVNYKHSCAPTWPSVGLNDTLTGLLSALQDSIYDIKNYAKKQRIYLKNFHVKNINMTRMTTLAAQTSLQPSNAVQLRNYVLLDMLDQAATDIRLTGRSCFNNQVKMLHPCRL